jgi:glycerate dehydrogenase
MENAKLLITFACPPEIRKIIEDLVGNRLTPLYFTDLKESDIDQAAHADYVLALNLHQEIPETILEKAQWSFLQMVTAGVDHLHFSKLPNHFMVAGNSGAYAEPMAEHVLAMALALAKNLLLHHEKIKQGEFDQYGLNDTLRGKIFGIFGFGGIGKASARLMRCLSMKIYAVNRSGQSDEPVDWLGTTAELPFLLQNADVLLIAAPLSKSTYGAMGKKELDLMKENAMLINVARGEIVDEQALYEHLLGHPHFKAGIDAWWVEPFRHGRFEMHYPFLSLPNVLGSPHNSGRVAGVFPKAVQMAVNNLLAYLEKRPVKGMIDRNEYIYT